MKEVHTTIVPAARKSRKWLAAGCGSVLVHLVLRVGNYREIAGLVEEIVLSVTLPAVSVDTNSEYRKIVRMWY